MYLAKKAWENCTSLMPNLCNVPFKFSHDNQVLFFNFCWWLFLVQPGVPVLGLVILNIKEISTPRWQMGIHDIQITPSIFHFLVTARRDKESKLMSC